MYTQALFRVGAVWSLRLDHIKLSRRIIQIRDNPDLNWTNKAYKQPDKPINDKLYKILKRDLKSRPPEHVYYLDNGCGQPWYRATGEMGRAMKKVQQRVGLPDVKPFHEAFRATMITELLVQGTSPMAVQMLADHSDLSVTLMYLNRRKIDQHAAAQDIPPIG
jgi:integrase